MAKKKSYWRLKAYWKLVERRLKHEFSYYYGPNYPDYRECGKFVWDYRECGKFV